MANRFTDTTKWNEDWYCELGGEYQLFWDFITDMCDNAGVWKPNKMDFEIKTKFRVNLDSFFKKVNGDKQRILLLDNGRWFLPGFISYQWFNKKETFDLVLSNRLHKSLYEILLKNNIHLKKLRGLKEVLKASMEKDKEKAEAEQVGGVGEGFFINEISTEMELTVLDVSNVKNFIENVCQKKITDADVNRYWQAFKLDNFGKKEWYNDREKLISHFRHTLKNQLSKNGSHNTSANRNGISKGKSTGAYELLEELRGNSTTE